MTAQEILASIDPTNMETFARAVLMLSPEGQDGFFASLVASGLSTEEVADLQMCVSLYKLHTNQRFYNAVRDAVGESLANEWGIA
jgi:hypothetical protein